VIWAQGLVCSWLLGRFVDLGICSGIRYRSLSGKWSGLRDWSVHDYSDGLLIYINVLWKQLSKSTVFFSPHFTTGLREERLVVFPIVSRSNATDFFRCPVPIFGRMTMAACGVARGPFILIRCPLTRGCHARFAGRLAFHIGVGLSSRGDVVILIDDKWDGWFTVC
jgi:hypothetical protein